MVCMGLQAETPTPQSVNFLNPHLPELCRWPQDSPLGSGQSTCSGQVLQNEAKHSISTWLRVQELVRDAAIHSMHSESGCMASEGDSSELLQCRQKAGGNTIERGGGLWNPAFLVSDVGILMIPEGSE